MAFDEAEEQAPLLFVSTNAFELTIKHNCSILTNGFGARAIRTGSIYLTLTTVCLLSIPAMNEKKMSILSSKWVSLILMVLGAAILITLFVFFIFGFPSPKSVDRLLPEQIAGYQLSKQITGSEAVAEFAQLHGKHLAVTSGAKGIYGEWNAVTLWVATADTTERANALLVDMELKIS
ncbi:MAG: hypothetical protein ACYDHA_07345, partial [Bellilinea sp.]